MIICTSIFGLHAVVLIKQLEHGVRFCLMFHILKVLNLEVMTNSFIVGFHSKGDQEQK